MGRSDIVYCKIYPGTGIARVGNSPDDFFIGPETPGAGPEANTQFKDTLGRIKRQAARFRVYGYDAADNVVQEVNVLTPGIIVQWSVQLANRKASGSIFAGVRQGMELDKNPDPEKLRNKSVKDRKVLEIAPRPRSIGGVNRFGQQYWFDDGEFHGEAVYLGELRTDDAGRLMVLGGRGKSGSIEGARPISHYANNDGWYDDTSDGLVDVQITLNGTSVPVRGSAWVIVAPPKYAPYVRNVVSLYDVMSEAVGVPAPDRVSFTDHVYPHFAAFGNQQWVNGMALRGHGPQKGGNFLDPATIEKLADNSEASKAFRLAILRRLRVPAGNSIAEANYNFMPQLSGDQGDATVGKPDTWLTLTKGVYSLLQRWAVGEFESDWPGQTPTATPFNL